MTRDVNAFVGKPRLTGATVAVPQRAVDITLQWVDDAGKPRSATTTAYFPSLIADPEVSRDGFQEQMMQLVLQALRVKLGIEPL